MFSDFDPFAWIYNTHWGSSFHGQSLRLMRRLLLDELPPGTLILDLCCGVGHMAEQLVAAGYRVIGIEGSSEMLRYAKDRLPESELYVGDARTFTLASPVRAVVSTFDSLNHILEISGLYEAFERVSEALLPGGVFVFDLNREEAYRDLWVRSYPLVEADKAQFARGRYDPDLRLAACDVTLFRWSGEWTRSDFTIQQRCYSEIEIRAGLMSAGFTSVEHFDAGPDLGMTGDIAHGRSFYKCRKPD